MYGTVRQIHALQMVFNSSKKQLANDSTIYSDSRSNL